MARAVRPEAPVPENSDALKQRWWRNVTTAAVSVRTVEFAEQFAEDVVHVGALRAGIDHRAVTLAHLLPALRREPRARRRGRLHGLERVAPGQFQESASGSRVFFIDKDSPDNRFGNHVFVSSIENGLESVTTAQTGHVDMVGNERFLMLDKGQQWLTNLETGETRLTQFEHYEVLMDDEVIASNEGLSSRHTASWNLMKQPTRENLGELAWRMGLGLAAINLVLLALAVSAINPRVGRSYHLGMALFIFIAYYNMLNVGQSWIASGRVPFASFLVALHGGVFLLAIGWLYARHMNWSWRALWPRREPAAEASA